MSTSLDLAVHQPHVQAARAADAGKLLLATRTHAGQKAPPRCRRTPHGAR